MTNLSLLLLFFCLSIVQTKETGFQDDSNDIAIVWYPLPITLKKLYASQNKTIHLSPFVLQLNKLQNITKHLAVCTRIPTKNTSKITNAKAPLNENLLDLLTGAWTSYYDQKNTGPIHISKQKNNSRYSNDFQNSTHINTEETKTPAHTKIVYDKNIDDASTTDYENGNSVSAYDVNLPTAHQLDPTMENYENQEQQSEDFYLLTDNPIKTSTFNTYYEDSSVDVTTSEIEARILIKTETPVEVHKTENISHNTKQPTALIKESTLHKSKSNTTSKGSPETSTILELPIEDYTVLPTVPTHTLSLLDTVLSNSQDTTISSEITAVTDSSKTDNTEGISTHNYEFSTFNLKGNENLGSDETSTQESSMVDSLVDELLQLLIKYFENKEDTADNVTAQKIISLTKQLLKTYNDGNISSLSIVKQLLNFQNSDGDNIWQTLLPLTEKSCKCLKPLANLLALADQ